MSHESVKETIREHIEVLQQKVSSAQIILDYLRITQPLTLDATQLWLNTWDAMQDDKAAIRQLKDTLRFLTEVTTNPERD